jgi:hypothetical protein
MSKFTDSAGREWTLDINLDSVETVKSELQGLSLYELLNDHARPLGELIANLPLLAHVCYILADVAASGVDQRSFAKALKGDTLNAMLNAFLEELTDFFHEPAQRAAMQEFLKTCRAIYRTAGSMLTSELQKMTANPETALTEILSMPHGKPRASSDST